MIEFDTQIIPTARAMSFLFSGRVQLSKCVRNCGLPRRCVRCDTAGCARVGADGCRALARGLAPRDFWTVLQEKGADFAMGPGLLGGFRRELFAVSFSDLGKRRRWVAFRADSPCETAQKFADGVRLRRRWRILTCVSVWLVPVGTRV